MSSFPFTPEGCANATAFLKDTNRYHLLERELSTDGWTLVALANALKERDNE